MENYGKKGLGGKFLRLIQEMYRGQRRKIKTKTGWTKWVQCNKGLRQGCVFSPILFAIYIDDILVKINEDPNRKRNVEIGNTKMSVLAFSDDIPLLAMEEKELEKMINQVKILLGVQKTKT